MARIEAYRVTDFSGGVRRDKSSYELQKNELLDGRNITISDRGRIVGRNGGQQFGPTIASAALENCFFFVSTPGGSAPSTSFLVNDSATTGAIYQIRGSRVTSAVAAAATTITVNDASQFTASGNLEIDGDLIAYTGITGSNLTGCTGVTSAHAVGAPVHQWLAVTQSGSAVDARMGVTYASIGGKLIFGGRVGNIKQANSSLTVTDVTGEPSIILLTNYRDRLYGVGDGSAGTNGSTVRVSFSARGDGTSWTTGSDYFDVFDTDGQYLMALKVRGDVMGIFKTNSIFTYDEIELKERVPGVGAFNQKVVQNLGGNIFTFCPNGIFETNLFSAKQIGEPVREYWENFVPAYDSLVKRVCTNTWAATYKDSYLLFIGDVTKPDTTSNVVLEFDTVKRAWTVHNGGFTNFLHLLGTGQFKFGDGSLNYAPALFGGDSGGKAWRLYDNKYKDGGGTNRGSEIFKDLISDTGVPVPVSFETPFYDLSFPEKFKTFKNLRILSEQGNWTVEYRVEDENGFSHYEILGTTRKQNEVLPFPASASGYRAGFRISSVSDSGSVPIFNGLVFEDTEVVKR